MNPLDDILTQFTPARLLQDPRAQGAGVSVCVIDSGVDRAALLAKHAQEGRAIRPIQGAIFSPDRAAPLPYEGRHSTPHGTTVADVLLTLAPDIDLYSADVFGPLGTCEVEVVVQAIYHAIDVWKVKIVNLSLGVTEQKLQPVARRQQLLRAIEDAYFKDVVVIAAAHNDHPITRSYPALFGVPLISVDKHLFAEPWQFAYQLRDQIEFQAHGRGYFGPFAQEPATSWAAPHLAGIAARLLSWKPTLKPFEVKALLYWLSQKTGERGASAP